MKPKNKPLRVHGGNGNCQPAGQSGEWVSMKHSNFRNLLILSVVMGFAFGFWVGFLYHGGF